MEGSAEVPIEWFGEFVPRVGDTLEVVVNARVSKIEQTQVDVRGYGDRGPNTLGGQIHATLILTQLKFPLHELERLTGGDHANDA